MTAIKFCGRSEFTNDHPEDAQFDLSRYIYGPQLSDISNTIYLPCTFISDSLQCVS